MAEIYGAPIDVSIHKWTDDETRKLIQLRMEYDNRFTGKRHTAKKAWEEMLKKMAIDDTVTATQLSKKWDNLKRKYKNSSEEMVFGLYWEGDHSDHSPVDIHDQNIIQEIRFSPSGAGTDKEATPTTWAYFKIMHEAVGDGSAIEYPVMMDSLYVVNKRSPDMDSGSRVSPPPAPVKATSSQTYVEEPGSSNFTQDSEPSTSTGPPPCKRERRRRKEEEKSVLQFLEAEAAREEERFQATQESTKRFLELFEDLVKKS